MIDNVKITVLYGMKRINEMPMIVVGDIAFCAYEVITEDGHGNVTERHMSLGGGVLHGANCVKDLIEQQQFKAKAIRAAAGG